MLQFEKQVTHSILKTLSLTPLLLAATLCFGAPCDEPLSPISSVVDLSPYVPESELLGFPSGENRWLLGEGGEGLVERVKVGEEFHIEKTFFTSMFAQQNLSHWELLQSFGIKSFKTFDKVSLKGRVQSYQWIKGVTLIKILENPKVAQAVKEKLWSIYESKLIELTNELISKRPDLTFDINHLPYLNKLHVQINKADNLSFKELRISGIPSTLDRITFRQRYLIEVYEDINEDPKVLEPKPDNILVDLKTWEMTWIDPN